MKLSSEMLQVISLELENPIFFKFFISYNFGFVTTVDDLAYVYVVLLDNFIKHNPLFSEE